MKDQVKMSFEDLLDKVSNEVESIELGYEMGCQISVEFTPSPNYGVVLDYIKSYGWEIKEFMDELYRRAKSQEGKINDDISLCFWDSEEGNIYCLLGHYVEKL